MDATVAALIGALGGGLVASIGPLFATRMQAKAEHRREKLRLAVQLAMQERTELLELAKSRRGGAMIAPVSAMVIYHIELLELAEATAEITPEHMVEMRGRAQRIFNALIEEQQRESQTSGAQ